MAEEAMARPDGPGSRPADQAPTGLDASRFDPSREYITHYGSKTSPERARMLGALSAAIDAYAEIISSSQEPDASAKRMLVALLAEFARLTQWISKAAEIELIAANARPRRDSDEHPKDENAKRLSGEAVPARAEGIAQPEAQP